jgi:fumarylpyruvate hydrolase
MSLSEGSNTTEAVEVTLPVADNEQRFRVCRVFCVGRNYAEHAREMGGTGEHEAPFFFTKFADSVVAEPSTIAYPSATENLHHEVELVVAISQGAAQASDWQDMVFGYAVGIDLTRRDLQAKLKAKGRPWDMAKNFPQAAPMSALSRYEDVGHPRQGAIELRVNEQLRQQGDLGQMLWPVDAIIEQLQRYTQLKPGDLIMTGTPAGVAALVPGDRVEARIEGLVASLRFSVV